MKKKILISIIVIAFLQMNLSCSKEIIVKKIVGEYPNFFITNKGVNDISKAIESAYYKLDYRGGQIKKFSNDKSKSDSILSYYVSSGFFKNSKAYSTNRNENIPLWTDFIVLISKTSENNLKVTVDAVNIRVEIGKKLLPSFPHFGDNPKFKNMSKPVFEEYLFLSKIGKELGVSVLLPSFE